MDCFSVINKIDEKFQIRANQSSTLLIFLFALQALYIYLTLMFGGKEVEEYGKEYIFNSLELALLFVLLNLIGNLAGAEANVLD